MKKQDTVTGSEVADKIGTFVLVIGFAVLFFLSI
ncbi:hypothetical protein [Synechococcus phage BUCT-ZZ01]|nr:hypothetical protein [Synechococcus phage BUCT-ZZ01]